MLLIKNTKAEAHGLTREDKKSQAPAFPHSKQFPTNTDILGEAQTLPPMWEDRERGGKKDHLERYIPSTRLCPTGTPRGCLVPVLNYKIPRAQGDRQGQSVLLHLSDIPIAPARSEEFFLLLCYYRWEGASSKTSVSYKNSWNYQ